MHPQKKLLRWKENLPLLDPCKKTHTKKLQIKMLSKELFVFCYFARLLNLSSPSVKLCTLNTVHIAHMN